MAWSSCGEAYRRGWTVVFLMNPVALNVLFNNCQLCMYYCHIASMCLVCPPLCHLSFMFNILTLSFKFSLVYSPFPLLLLFWCPLVAGISFSSCILLCPPSLISWLGFSVSPSSLQWKRHLASNPEAALDHLASVPVAGWNCRRQCLHL